MYNATSVAGGDNPRSHLDEVFASFKAPRATGLALAIVLHGLGTWECEKEGRGDNQGQRNSPDRARVAAHAATASAMQAAQQQELEAMTDMFNKCVLTPSLAAR